MAVVDRNAPNLSDLIALAQTQNDLLRDILVELRVASFYLQSGLNVADQIQIIRNDFRADLEAPTILS